MRCDWDERKRAANLAKHGVDFTLEADFVWSAAMTNPDVRHDYGEVRWESVSLIGDRLHVLVWTDRGPGCRRIISLRKANTRERRRYAEDLGLRIRPSSGA